MKRFLIMMASCLLIGGCVQTPRQMTEPTANSDSPLVDRQPDAELVRKITSATSFGQVDTLDRYSANYIAASRLLSSNKEISALAVIRAAEKTPDVFVGDRISKLGEVLAGWAPDTSNPETDRTVIADRLKEFGLACFAAARQHEERDVRR